MICLNNSILWMWLNQKTELNRTKQLKLFEEFKSIEAIYAAGVSDFSKYDFLSEKEINNLCTKNADEMNYEYDLLKKHNSFIISIDSENYPQMLKEISDPPTVLYCRGNNINLNDRLCIAVVGTRKATVYGKSVAFNLSGNLASQGVVIVSGMAMGIDSKAHEGAIFAKAPTVAVIGCGVNIVYPKVNSELMRNIIKTGMVISEYPLGSKPAKFHFPERNRIISGLCQGTVVVEADIKSGSLITAKSSYEQGRDVFAVPGNINSLYSKGTNYLIKDGARVVTCDEDVLSYYRLDYAEKLINSSFEYERAPIDDINENEINGKAPEDIILSVISEAPVHIDTICEKSGLDLGCINSALMLMELRGKIIKLPGGFYQKS